MLSEYQVRILKHVVGFNSQTPFYRNYYSSGPGSLAWGNLLFLCDSGFMEIRHRESRWNGGLTVFRVTEKGLDLLKRENNDL